VNDAARSLFKIFATESTMLRSLFSFFNRYRILHLTWFAFLLSFVVSFSVPPFATTIQHSGYSTMEISKNQIRKQLDQAELLSFRLPQAIGYLKFLHQGFDRPKVAQTLSAQSLSRYDYTSEIFTFQVPNYAISHQNGAILNIKVAYCLTLEATSQNDYLDFVPVREEIDNYLTHYPDNNDYWEIVNKKLVKRLLDKYPQMSSLRVELGVMPTPMEPSARSSIVLSTRS
jgi:hypothetical protein